MIINIKTGTDADIVEAHSMDLLHLRLHHLRRSNVVDFSVRHHSQFFRKNQGGNMIRVSVCYGPISGFPPFWFLHEEYSKCRMMRRRLTSL